LSYPEPFRAIRLNKKIDAGAKFIQTQAVYDVDRFKRAMKRIQDMGLTERVAILPGIILPMGPRMLKHMDANVPGIEVPEAMIKRLKQADRPKVERLKITAELIEAIKEIPGVKGVHVQAIEAEHLLSKVMERAGLLPRPAVSH
jgi:5,10-methylenetetrahydrofolate reductase